MSKQMITHIGNIQLDVPMWWDNYSSSNFFIEEIVPTIDGGFIAYRIPKKDMMITISSPPNQRQTLITKDAIIALSQINAPTTITDYDGVIHNVEFVHNSEFGAVQFESMVEARLSDIWIGEIKVRTI